jgi:uncharacterized protein YbjT (DUF2867 family)
MEAEAAKLKVILTGATGMVGEGVLFACLEHPAIERVLIVNRKAYGGAKHSKLRECIVPDFLDVDGVAGGLTGYDACFYCAGISSVGMSEAEYRRVTYDVPVHFAQVLLKLNPQMTFCYVSGAHTDSSEQGRVMWARVKGRAENALMKLGFPNVYNFRPGFMKATAGQRNLKWYYSLIGGLYPLLRVMLPNQVSTLRDVGLAMIHCVLRGYSKPILEVKDINAQARA